MAKLGAEAFLYLSPPPNEPEFAQCSTCRDWVKGDDRCYIHGSHVRVAGSMSCGLYVEGEPLDEGTPVYAVVSPIESGLVDREVRCENCFYGGPDVYKCRLFIELNKTLPEVFEIEEDIEPKGCCNAQTPPDGGAGSDL